MTVRVLLPLAPGTNCDRELWYAFEKAGAKVESARYGELAERKNPFDAVSIVAFPGGFSYGDDVASGKIVAVDMGARMADQLRSFIDRGGHILGICNGFQTLVKSGLLPGFTKESAQAVTLTYNQSGRFEDRWVSLESMPCRAKFVAGGEIVDLPVAHAEGQFLARDAATLQKISDEGFVAFRYVTREGKFPAAYPGNPNGSALGVAGICDITGRVLGLMPHPERNVELWHHPEWTRRPPELEPAGFRILRNLVDAARANE